MQLLRLEVRKIIKPLTTVTDMPVSTTVCQSHQLVITLNVMEPILLRILESISAIRSPIDEIAYREQMIDGFIEPIRFKLLLEEVETPV
jgi:hypothetical protein